MKRCFFLCDRLAKRVCVFESVVLKLGDSVCMCNEVIMLYRLCDIVINGVLDIFFLLRTETPVVNQASGAFIF